MLKVSLFERIWGGDRPLLLPQSSSTYIHLSFQGLFTFKHVAFSFASEAVCQAYPAQCPLGPCCQSSVRTGVMPASQTIPLQRSGPDPELVSRSTFVQQHPYQQISGGVAQPNGRFQSKHASVQPATPPEGGAACFVPHNASGHHCTMGEEGR